MTLPNYLVIGAPKCGTTSMCDLLGSHPDVFMSDPKEPHYFGRDDPEKTWEWYLSLFRDADGATAVGEGSTSYTHPNLLPDVASAVASRLPGARLIYMVRHPVKRLESDWRMRKHEGWAEGTINESVRQQDSLIGHGLYWRNIQPYLRSFPRDQLLVVFLEDFAEDPRRELRRVFVHIGVDPDVHLADPGRPRNRSSDFRKDGLLAGILRKVPGFDSVKRWLPPWVVSGGKLLLTAEEDLRVRWAPEIEAATVRAFQEDSAAFLEFFGKPPDFWFSTE